MKKNLVIVFIITCFLAFKPNEKQKHILIIGDSISIGYTPFVAKYLADKATVVHNKGNAQHTGTGLEKVEEWLGTQKWDIIQFNWGLWDLCYRHPDSKVQGKRDKINGDITYDVDQYAANLDSLVTIIKRKSKAKLIFVTTSFVPEAEQGRFTEDAIKYNDAAKVVMKKHGVIVNDIYESSIAIHKDYGTALDNVHYEKDGYVQLGELVAKFLEKEMED
ncbi:SGNH/GDSL hydrolase family protein [Portibacter lacus]|uniref:SGNH/GDSL hydrolase family protein n=1 Tax=Portibacter lacus TaxID=1099794 RepID=A0AA37WCW2_9BACT|nr:SGNH/GDSL hydrolase family protein [Portibacter lacus]GLR17081.1 hypothetical protein GCM10007940_16960 [Portibacter lacus]